MKKTLIAQLVLYDVGIKVCCFSGVSAYFFLMRLQFCILRGLECEADLVEPYGTSWKGGSKRRTAEGCPAEGGGASARRYAKVGFRVQHVLPLLNEVRRSSRLRS